MVSPSVRAEMAPRWPSAMLRAMESPMPKPPAVEDLPPFQYCMYNKNQMIYASSHRFFQHYSIIPLRRSGHQPHAGRLSGKLRLFRPQLLHWPDTVGYSAKAYFLRHRRPRAQLGASGAVPSGQRSGHLRPGDDTTGQRDALASLAVNRPRQQKIPGTPKACRVSASHCICSQPIKARCAG